MARVSSLCGRVGLETGHFVGFLLFPSLSPKFRAKREIPIISNELEELFSSLLTIAIPCSGFQDKSLLFNRNPQRLHLPIQMTSLQSQNFRCAAHIAVVLVQFFQDVVAFVSGPSLMQRGEA